MAEVFKSKIYSAITTSYAVGGLVVPAGKKWLLLGLNASNLSDTAAINFSAKISKGGGAEAVVINNVPIPINNSLSYPLGKMVLDATESMSVKKLTGQTAGCDVILSYMELDV